MHHEPCKIANPDLKVSAKNAPYEGWGFAQLHVCFAAEWNYGVIRGGEYTVIMILTPWAFGERFGPWVWPWDSWNKNFGDINFEQYYYHDINHCKVNLQKAKTKKIFYHTGVLSI